MGKLYAVIVLDQSRSAVWLAGARPYHHQYFHYDNAPQVVSHHLRELGFDVLEVRELSEPIEESDEGTIIALAAHPGDIFTVDHYDEELDTHSKETYRQTKLPQISKQYPAVVRAIRLLDKER